MTSHTLDSPRPSEVTAILAAGRRDRFRHGLYVVLGLAGVGIVFYLADVLNLMRYRDAYRTITTLIGDALPPDFSRWRSWGKPLVETLAMSAAGTAIACVLALPLSTVAARNTGTRWLSRVIRMLLNTARSIPDVVWGIACVAAVGFGPLPGALALACHSTGVLGEFYAEILEHVDPAPGDALRSQGVSWLGVLRFALLPQVLPRFVDVSLYRWEHNVRSAIVLGVIGAGGIGLQIVTAFNLFEYREASALILVLLGLVTVINATAGRIRARFLTPAT
jgi:phosphonate transport system permease protein